MADSVWGPAAAAPAREIAVRPRHQALVRVTHWIITLGDQPHLQDKTLRTLLRFSAGYPDKICQPLRDERRKHPVLIPKQLFQKLQTTTANDLKIFLVEHATELSGFQSDDMGLDFDIDTPEDYQHALKIAFPGNEPPIG